MVWPIESFLLETEQGNQGSKNYNLSELDKDIAEISYPFPKVTIYRNDAWSNEFDIKLRKEVVVDWGDGIKEKVFPNGDEYVTIDHIYVDNFSRVINITGTKDAVAGLSFKDGPNMPYGLSKLIIERSTDLEELYFSDQRLDSLDISKNTKLKKLKAWYFPVKELDLSKNVELEELLFHRADNLKELDLSKNTKLKSLAVQYPGMAFLDISKNTELEYLEHYGKLSNLGISKNLKLKHINCPANDNGILDVTPHTQLQTLICKKLKWIDVSKNLNLTYLKCSYGELTNLDVSKNTILKVLDCESNKLPLVDVSLNLDLEELHCGSNDFNVVDIRKNKKLKKLYYGNGNRGDHVEVLIENNPDMEFISYFGYYTDTNGILSALPDRTGEKAGYFDWGIQGTINWNYHSQKNWYYAK